MAPVVLGVKQKSVGCSVQLFKETLELRYVTMLRAVFFDDSLNGSVRTPAHLLNPLIKLRLELRSVSTGSFEPDEVNYSLQRDGRSRTSRFRLFLPSLSPPLSFSCW